MTDTTVPAGEAAFLSVTGLRKHFRVRSAWPSRHSGLIKAVDDVSFTLANGETLGVVGESGCGKSTMVRLLMRLLVPDAGAIAFRGERIDLLGRRALRRLRRQVQMVFQDSHASLNPRLAVGDTIAFGPMVHGMSRAGARSRARDLLRSVELDPDLFEKRYPHQLSGGQRQRVNIARALALEPRLMILDEAVSALDKSVEAQVLTLLAALKQRLDLTYIFISHDLNVVQYISDRVLVMYLGKVVELGTVAAIFGGAKHPYTQALLASRPTMDPTRRTAQVPLSGDPPNPVNPPSGCRFRTRCRFAEAVCASLVPTLAIGDGDRSHAVACHMFVAGSGHGRAIRASG